MVFEILTTSKHRKNMFVNHETITNQRFQSHRGSDGTPFKCWRDDDVKFSANAYEL